MKLLFLIFCFMLTTVAYASEGETTIEKFDRQMQHEDDAYNIDYIRRQNEDIEESQQRLQETLDRQDVYASPDSPSY